MRMDGLIGTTPNLARPGQRMLSSMTPTILERNGALVAVLGTPGGRTIINTVLQLIFNLVDFQMSVEAAVAAPRIHHQWLPDEIALEEGGVVAFRRGRWLPWRRWATLSVWTVPRVRPTSS